MIDTLFADDQKLPSSRKHVENFSSFVGNTSTLWQSINRTIGITLVSVKHSQSRWNSQLIKLLLITYTFLSGGALGQVIDAESYIKKNGFQKKVARGFGVFYSTIKQVNKTEMAPYLDAIKQMPRTDEVKEMCQKQAIGIQKYFDLQGRGDLILSHSIGYGGTLNGKFGCVYFIEVHGALAGSQVYFSKIVLHGESYDHYTVVVMH